MVKIAIVGTGIIGLTHIKSIKEAEGCTLVALCDINEESVKPLAEENGVPYFLDYKEIPEKVNCDAVILNLPHGLHCASTVFFLEAGINVLIEKPMANTLEECKMMLDAEKRSGKKLAVAHPQRYFHAIEKMHELASNPELGELCMVTGTRSINYFADWRPKWFFSKKASGGGIFMNFGAHELDKIQYITGRRVKKIMSSYGNLKNDYDIEGHAQVFGKLDNGASFALTFSGYSPAAYDEIFYFTNGAIRCIGSELVQINRGTGWEDIPVPTEPFNLTREITEFVKYVEGDKANIPDAEYGKDIIEAIEAAYANPID